jgi:pimeloyl-ACP methyl ester carboxylesterase
MMTSRRIVLTLLAAALSTLGVGTATAAAVTARTTVAADVVGQDAPKLVPHSKLPGPGAFEGPVNKVAVGGIEIGYRQFGHGPDLIMVTGDTAPMSLWLPCLLHPLAANFTVTIFDNRGVGYSTDDLSRPITVPLMAHDTGELIEALGLQKPTLVGWSMGGEIGLTLAEQKPALLGALVTTGGDAGSSHTVPPPPGLVRKLANPKTGDKVFLELLFPPTPAGGAATARFVRS